MAKKIPVKDDTIQRLATCLAVAVQQREGFDDAFNDLMCAVSEPRGLRAADVAEQARRVVDIERELTETGRETFRAFRDAQRIERAAFALAAYHLGGALTVASTIETE